MLAFAKHQFWLAGYDQGSTVCRRDALAQIEKTLGRKPIQLQGAPELPEHSAYLWELYVNLHNASGAKIGYNEINAYQQVTGCTLKPFEVDLIMTIDREAKNG